MQVVGFHQARRPRLSPGAKLRRELSLPRPGGVALCLAGAALVFSGASALAAPDQPGTTPAVTSANTVTSAPLAAPVLPPLAKSDGPAASLLPDTAPEPVVVPGAAADSPLQQLFSTAAPDPQDQALRDLANPASLLVIVNKHHSLNPLDFVPTDLVEPALPGSHDPVLLRSEAAAALERMLAAANAENVHITVKSSYRSHAKQQDLYNGYVADKGVAATEATSARPGFSEHQTGLALDIGDADAGSSCDFSVCFADTPAGQWVAAHAAEHGFVIRYLPGEETVTGYSAEPWHLRYLGAAVAQDMRAREIHSYETFAGLPAASGYK